MPTVIDSLIVELGLDPAKFTSEQKKAVAGLGEIERKVGDLEKAETTRQQSATRQANNRTQAAERESARALKRDKDALAEKVKAETEATKRRAESLNTAKNAAVGFATALAAVGVEKFVMQTAAGVAETGRLAYNLDSSTAKVSAWGRAVEQSVGGSAQAATGDLQKLTQMLVRARQFGDQSLVPLASQLERLSGQQFSMTGPDGKPLDAEGLLKELSTFAPKIDPATFGTILAPYLSQDNINFVERGPKFVNDALALQARTGTPSDAEARADQQLLAATTGLEQAFKRLGEQLVFAIAPDLSRFMLDFSSVIRLITGKISFSDFQKERSGHWREELVDFYAGKGLSAANAGVAADNAIKNGIDPTVAARTGGDTTPGLLRRVGQWLGIPAASGQSVAQLPSDIDAEVRKDAAARGVDPEVAVALFRREGGGYNKVSGAGAFGPAQLMPGTARMMGLAESTTQQDYDWHTNVDGGVRYLAGLIQRFHGNTDAAIAAYNAGPGGAGVNKFAATGDGSELPNETKAYLASIRSITGPGAAHPAMGPSPSTSTSTSETKIGEIHVHGVDTNNVSSIAGGIQGAVAAHPLVVQSNTGLD